MNRTIHFGGLLLAGMLGLGHGAGEAPAKAPVTEAVQAQGAEAKAVNPAVVKPAPEGKEQALKRRQARTGRHVAVDAKRQEAMAKAKAVYTARQEAEKASSSQMVNEALKKEEAAKKK